MRPASPTAPAEIAGEIEEAGGVLHPLRRQRAERHVVDRDHRRHQPDAAEDLRPDELPEIPVAGEIGHPPAAQGKAQETHRQHEARIDLRHQPARDRRGQEHGEA